MENFNIEGLMYQVSGLFLLPVLLIIVGLFIYSFYLLGEFAAQWFQRRKNAKQYQAEVNSLGGATPIKSVAGYPLFNQFTLGKARDLMGLKLYALTRLEKARIVTRVAPMMGLVATMVPMGPALKSLADGNVQGISENLVIAFSAVIFGLITASITFWIAAVRKRWMSTELNDLKSVLPDAEA